MNLEDVTITSAGIQVGLTEDQQVTSMIERIQADKAHQGAPRGKVVYLYSPSSGTVISKKHGLSDGHLGGIED